MDATWIMEFRIYIEEETGRYVHTHVNEEE